MNPAHFQYYKAAGVTFAFATTVVLQWAAPYRAPREGMRGRWQANFGLGAAGALVLGTICGGCVCLIAGKMEQVGFGVLRQGNLSPLFQIVVTIGVLDLVAYLWHRMNHRVKFFWRFHAVHHSDLHLDASSAIRFHPGELVISLLPRLMAVVLLGLPVWGLLIFEVIYALFNFFVHGNISLPARMENALGKIFVTPALHRKHHSENPWELQSNFGTIFSVWDRAFGTHRGAHSQERIDVGLPSISSSLSLWDLLVHLPASPPSGRKPT